MAADHVDTWVEFESLGTPKTTRVFLCAHDGDQVHRFVINTTHVTFEVSASAGPVLTIEVLGARGRVRMPLKAGPDGATAADLVTEIAAGTIARSKFGDDDKPIEWVAPSPSPQPAREDGRTHAQAEKLAKIFALAMDKK